MSGPLRRGGDSFLTHTVFDEVLFQHYCTTNMVKTHHAAIPFSSSGIIPDSNTLCTTWSGPLARLPKITTDSIFSSIGTDSLDVNSNNLSMIANKTQNSVNIIDRDLSV